MRRISFEKENNFFWACLKCVCIVYTIYANERIKINEKVSAKKLLKPNSIVFHYFQYYYFSLVALVFVRLCSMHTSEISKEKVNSEIVCMRIKYIFCIYTILFLFCHFACISRTNFRSHNGHWIRMNKIRGIVNAYHKMLLYCCCIFMCAA